MIRRQSRVAQSLPLRYVVDGGPQLSPDCRWLAYASDETGRREVFVRPFPDLEPRQQISLDGGNEPLWNPKPGSGELFYRQGDRMMVAKITGQGSADGGPEELFRRPFATTFNGFVRPNYDVSPDGLKFLMLKPVEQQPLTRITVVLNWLEQLRRGVPAD
jgi:hypothetical protein